MPEKGQVIVFFALVKLDFERRQAGGHAPDPGAAPGSPEQVVAVWTERHFGDLAFRTAEAVDDKAGLRIPDADGAVGLDGGHKLAVGAENRRGKAVGTAQVGNFLGAFQAPGGEALAGFIENQPFAIRTEGGLALPGVLEKQGGAACVPDLDFAAGG